jgi:PleD family two-component response regulator
MASVNIYLTGLGEDAAAESRRIGAASSGETHLNRYELGALEILLVAESSHVLETLRCALGAAGVIRLTVVPSVAVALSILGRRRFHAIYFHARLQGQAEKAFAAEVRQAKANRFTPIFIFEESPTVAAVQAARDSGASGYITLPVSAKSLVEKLETAVARARHFVETAKYFGPDRRARAQKPSNGERRAAHAR